MVIKVIKIIKAITVIKVIKVKVIKVKVIKSKKGDVAKKHDISSTFATFQQNSLKSCLTSSV